MGVSGFNSLFNTAEDTTSEVSSIPLSSSISFTNDHFHYPIKEETLKLPSLMDYLSMYIDYFDPIVSAHEAIKESEGSFFSQHLSTKGEDAISPT